MKEKKHQHARARLRQRAAEQRVARQPHYVERSPERDDQPGGRRPVRTGSFQTVQRVAHYIGSFPVPVEQAEMHPYTNRRLERLNIRKDSLGKTVKVMVFPDGVKVFQVDGETLFMAHALIRIMLAIVVREKQLFALVARNPSKSGGEFFCHCFHCRSAEEANDISTLVSKAFRISYAKKMAAERQREEQQALSSHHPRQEGRRGRVDEAFSERDREQGEKDMIRRKAELEEQRRRREMERQQEQALKQQEAMRRQEMLQQQEIQRQQEMQRQQEIERQHELQRQQEQRRQQEAAASEKMLQVQHDRQRLMTAGATGGASPITRRRVAHHRPVSTENHSQPHQPPPVPPHAQQAAPAHQPPQQQQQQSTATVPQTHQPAAVAHLPTITTQPPQGVLRRSVRRDRPAKTSEQGYDDLSASKSSPCLLDISDPTPATRPVPVSRSLQTSNATTPDESPKPLVSPSGEIPEKSKRNSLLALEMAAFGLSMAGGSAEDEKAMASGTVSQDEQEGSDDLEDEEAADIFDHDPASLVAQQQAQHEHAQQVQLESEAAALSEVEWFHAGIPRVIAMEILACQPPGVFMVRDSQTHRGCFALSMKSPSKGIIHYLIQRNADNSLFLKGETVEYDDLLSLIESHHLDQGILPCCLSTDNVNPNLVATDNGVDDVDGDVTDDYNNIDTMVITPIPDAD